MGKLTDLGKIQKNGLALAGVLILMLLIVIAYFPVNDAGSIMDDGDFYINDPVMKKTDGWQQIWFRPFENNHVWPYIPMTRFTFWLERQCFGLNLFVTHWLNVAFHLLSALLFWKVLRQLSIQGAWFAAMLFALHPVHVQSVVWIAERKNVVSGVFFLLTIWSFLHFEKEKGKGWYFLTLVLYLCALLSKTATIMLPLVFIICQIWLRISWKKTDLWKFLPFFLLGAGAAYARIWFELNSFGASGEEYARSFLERVLTAAHIPFFYLSKIIFPHPLIFTYPKWEIDDSQLFLYLPVLSVLLGVGVLLWKYRNWGRPLFLGVMAFGVLLFPVLGFFNNAWTRFSFVTDHWVYLPSIPIFVLLAGAFSSVTANLHVRKVLLLKLSSGLFWIGIFILLIILTQNQANLYRNPQILWKTTVARNPDSWIAHAQIGRLYLEEKQYELALQYLNKTFELTNENPFIEIYNYRGLTYLGLGQYDLALKDYNKALQMDPEYVNAYLNRGNTHIRLAQNEQALLDFNQAIKLDPKNVGGYFNRGNMYLWQRQYRQALEDYKTVLRLDPSEIKAWINRGTAHLYLQQYEQAIENYNAALKLNPNFLEIFFNRGTVYRYLKQNSKALADYNKTLEINPRHAGALSNRGLIYRELKQKELACSDWKMACQLGQCQYYSWAHSNNFCF
ncbi:MAG: tetratricopeptide repeat protein [SAR324 cluster bacterium]|nr:tetratricopeptide repeat protein [SAR324 cluster bacterium]